jgi:hypothetical protein
MNEATSKRIVAQAVAGAESMSLASAVGLLREQFSKRYPLEKALEQIVCGSAKLLFNSSYVFGEVALEDDRLRVYFDNLCSGMEAVVGVSLETENFALLLGENPLGLEIIDKRSQDIVKREGLSMKKLLFAGMAYYLTDNVYHTIPLALIFQPFGTEEFKVDAEKRAQYKSLFS